MSVVRFPGHKWLRHSECETIGCPICDGSLHYCRVCQCGEASLTTECPGYIIDYQGQEFIADGMVDYVNGRWVAKHLSAEDVAKLMGD